MNCKYKKNLLWLLVSATLVTGCGGSDSNSSSDTTTKDIQISGSIDQSISGLALGNNSEDSKDNLHDYVLAVLDYKNIPSEENKPRFVMLHMDKNGNPIVENINYQVEWSGHPKGNDLESICKLDDNYYLAAESGYYYDKSAGDYLYGRLFLIHRDASLDPDGLKSGLTVEKVYNIASNPENFANINFEGLACAQADGSESYNILLGDRKSGKLYWDSIDVNNFTNQNGETLNLKQVGEISAPKEWKTNRNISDLFYSTQDHHLYGAASFDSKISAHRSTLYRSSKAFNLEDTDFMKTLSPSSKINIDKIIDFNEDKIEGITGYGLEKGMFYGSDNDNNNNTFGYKLYSHITK